MSFPMWPDKDPQETLDFGFDWKDVEALGDVIATSTWTVPTGLTSVTESKTNTTTTIWLSGGAAGTRYTLVNTIQTSGGRTYERSVTLKVRSK